MVKLNNFWLAILTRVLCSVSPKRIVLLIYYIICIVIYVIEIMELRHPTVLNSTWIYRQLKKEKRKKLGSINEQETNE